MAKTVKRKKAVAGGSTSPSKRKSTNSSSREPSTLRGAGNAQDGADASHRWTFLTNHAHVLIVLNGDPSVVLREVAARVGITERAVQRIIHDLEESGIIRRKKIGRQNHYEVMAEKPLRHPLESHRNIDDLLSLF